MYTPKSSDETLRQGCLAGDRRAREHFYRRYYGKLVGIPRRYLDNKEDADQVLNQAFLRIFQSLDQYRDEGAFAGWLSTIVFRTTMSHLRSQKNHGMTVSIDDAFHHPPTSGGIEEAHDVEAIYAEIAKLPSALRSVFSLYVIDDFSHEEIGKILGISVNNSRWRLNQARTKLRITLRPNKEKTA
ncbi:RNA polymerase sigma factor [Neolewinella antarctica]|uniref:RNA polymerase sigma-70 factor (ECF subfamily) n=1 Tax=Neolewinella antarctica TaxID=442734 RepID=A0ABX0X7Q7_9BACT|nr:RNA polymerase sigma factor [Neolewinella antarctica]NJC25255.1 RNA polymerase sigma-70 factor (ECF subfamily) [Neolewinella antarctica]